MHFLSEKRQSSCTSGTDSSDTFSLYTILSTFSTERLEGKYIPRQTRSRSVQTRSGTRLIHRCRSNSSGTGGLTRFAAAAAPCQAVHFIPSPTGVSFLIHFQRQPDGFVCPMCLTSKRTVGKAVCERRTVSGLMLQTDFTTVRGGGSTHGHTKPSGGLHKFYFL